MNLRRYLPTAKLLHILRTITLFCIIRWLSVPKGHHQYLNHYGQPEARLMRTHSLSERRKSNKSPFLTGITLVMFWIPTMVLKRLRDIYVDGLVNGVDMKEFVDDFSAQGKAQTTLVSAMS